MTNTPLSHLSGVTLKKGSHELPSEGSCVMEVAALVAGYEWVPINGPRHLPPCMSKTIGAFLIYLNDTMRDHERQSLLPFVTRMAGTRASADVEQKRMIAILSHTAKPLLVDTLRITGHERAARYAEGRSNEFIDLLEIVDFRTDYRGDSTHFTLKGSVGDPFKPLMHFAQSPVFVPYRSAFSDNETAKQAIDSFRLAIWETAKGAPDDHYFASGQLMRLLVAHAKVAEAPRWDLCFKGIEAALAIGPRATEVETAAIEKAAAVLRSKPLTEDA